MFDKYLKQKLAVDYENKIIIFDFDNIEERYSYVNLLSKSGFNIIPYVSATTFRYIYHSEIENSDRKFAVIVNTDQYVPYDILQIFYQVDISWTTLFPKLNKDTLINDKTLDLDLLYSSYNRLYESISIFEKSNLYIIEEVYSKENIENYIGKIKEEIQIAISVEKLDHTFWIAIASKKGKAEYLAAKTGIEIDLSFIDEEFKKFVLNGYQSISSLIQKNSPIIVSRVMDYITKEKEKVALIVLDGMSIFDFNIISTMFKNIEYEEEFIYAMVPTTTAISRQCLLSGKFPIELERPFDLSHEEKEFKQKAKKIGYQEDQVLYSRGYDAFIGPKIKCLSVIVNDIDDLVHSQTQGRVGMFNDVSYLAKSLKIQNLISRLYKMGFNIYLTADHGNTLCQGLGMARGFGIEVETKSKRMFVLKDFANSSEVIEKYNLIEYPGFYLDKQYKYLICDTGTSLDIKGTTVMTHGGMSIDEVIVPFIKIKEVQNG